MRILTIGDDPKLLDYARSILNELRAHQVRAEIDESSDKINGKIQRAEQMKVHTMFVIGKRDMEANAVSVRVHGKGNLGAKPRAEAIAELLESIKTAAPVESWMGAPFSVEVLDGAPQDLCFRQTGGNWRTRFVPVCALLVGVRDLQNARFVQRFA